MKRIIFLDFDSTLFDADSFIAYTDEHGDFVTRLTGEFPDAPFQKFLFADVIPFLLVAREKGYQLVIVSAAMNSELQREKIVATGIAPLVDEIIVTPAGKSEPISHYLSQHGEGYDGHYFVDDLPLFIGEVKRAIPLITCVRIERKELAPFLVMRSVDASDRVVQSLDELKEELGLVWAWSNPHSFLL